MRSWSHSIRPLSTIYRLLAARSAAGSLAALGILLLCAWGGHITPPMPALAAGPAPSVQSMEDATSAPMFLPVVYGRSVSEVVSRAGLVVTSGALSAYPLERLPFGWYADYAVREAPARPGGVEYMQTILVRPEEYPPDWDLIRRAQANSGSIWKVGNEPECIYRACARGGVRRHLPRGLHVPQGVDPLPGWPSALSYSLRPCAWSGSTALGLPTRPASARRCPSTSGTSITSCCRKALMTMAAAFP